MEGKVSLLALQGLSKAELEELGTILGVQPRLLLVKMEADKFVPVLPTEHRLGEPATFLALWALLKNSKPSRLIEQIISSFVESRQAIEVKETRRITHPEGTTETIERMIVFKGKQASNALEKAEKISTLFHEQEDRPQLMIDRSALEELPFQNADPSKSSAQGKPKGKSSRKRKARS